MRQNNKGHQFDSIGGFFKTKPWIYIYGAGKEGMDLYRYLRPLGCVIGFLETIKTGGSIEGLPRLTPDELAMEKRDDFLIIFAAYRDFDMMKICVSHGFSLSILFSKKIFIMSFLPIFALYAYNKLLVNELPFSVTEKCTLRCEKCNHFTPYNKNAVHRNKEEIYSDFDLYFKYVDFVQVGSFVGGEALLHPNFCDIMEYVLSNYRDRYINCQVITNATVMPSDKLLELLKQYDTKIIVSDYRAAVPEISKKVTEFIDKAKQAGIELVVAEQIVWTDYAIGSAKNNFKSTDDIVRHFDYCNYPCRYLENGRLYFCTSDRMAQKLGFVPEDQYSYFDLTEPRGVYQQKAELMEFYYGFVNERGYLNSCASCYGGWTISPIKIPAAVQC